MYALRPTWPPEDRRPDDYTVRADGRDVGRIYRTIVPDGLRWRWSIYVNQHVHRVDGVPIAGLAPDLEQAKATFRASFDKMRHSQKEARR